MSTTPTPTTPTPASPQNDTPSADLHELVRERWSPRQFSSRPVDASTLRKLFEAARWAASCFNEQPWRFVLATRENPAEFNRILALLIEKNRAWAQGASALGFSAAKRTFTANGNPNRFGLHDTGAAAATLAQEATARGVRVHFMGGFDAEKAREEFGIPADFEVGAAFAIGYIDESATKPGTRSRKSLEELVFSGAWEKPADLG
jgi:nitroreductase